MADFHQNGIVATVHRLSARPVEDIESQILGWASIAPVALILPCLFTELKGPALPNIVRQLAQVPYLDTIVVPIGFATAAEFEEAKEFFSALPQRTALIWVEGERIEALLHDFAAAGLPVGAPGKGRACWLSMGYLLAEARCRLFALHDADILTYSRELLARLVYPVISPAIGYDFCKGYYARVSADRMHGRVTRLLMYPLLRAMEIVLGAHTYIRYLSSFHYPLAGEFALDADLAEVVRIPCSWGVEVGVLSEVYRNRSTRRICQAEILDAYDHKHQNPSVDDPEKGLHRMAIDIVTHMLRAMMQIGIRIHQAELHTLIGVYRRSAEDMIASYHADAAIDGLTYDRHAEEGMVEMFTGAIRTASARFLADPVGEPDLPNWIRVAAAMPNVYGRLLKIVRDDGGLLRP